MRVRRKTQAERRQDSETGLLEAAIDVIARQGVAAVTFDAVGSVSGLSRGLATQRFGSKQKMIEALLLHLHARQETLVQRFGLDELRGLEAVLAYVDTCLGDLATGAEARAYFMLLSSAIGDASGLKSVFEQTHRAVGERLRGWVAKGQSDGTVNPALDPQSCALMIGCLIFGASMQMLVDPQMDMRVLRETSLTTLNASLTA